MVLRLARASVCARVVLGSFVWLATASAAEADESPAGEEHGDEAQEMPADQVPVSLRETRAPKHADCDHRTPLWEHVVRPGEHLGLIAGHYGVRRRDVVGLNPQIEDPDLIRPGDKIRVCPEIAPRVTEEVEVWVKPGETLGAIASRYEMTTDGFLEAQREPIADPNRIRAGQVLRFEIDGGMVEAFQPPPPRARRSSSGTATRSRSRVETRLQPREGIHIKRPHLAFGTAKTIRLLEDVIERYQRKVRQGPPVIVGDISKKGGGRIRPHVSHRSGRDIDVGYVLRGAAAGRTRFAGVNRDNLDLGRTWALIKAFLDTHEVVYIFMDYEIQAQLYEFARDRGTSVDELDELFQYPRGRGRNHGIVRHWPSHKHHFHVRLR